MNFKAKPMKQYVDNKHGCWVDDAGWTIPADPNNAKRMQMLEELDAGTAKISIKPTEE